MRFHRTLSSLFAALAVSAGVAVAADAPEMLQLESDRSVDLQSFLAAGGRCGTVDLSPETTPREPQKGMTATIAGTVQIPVAFHVIYKETLKDGKKVRVGDVPLAQLQDQIRVLNEAYGSAGFIFTLRSVDRRLNSTWFKMTMGSSDERNAKAALAVDPTHVLNIYTAGPGNNLLGWAYFPWAYPENNFMHGCVLLYTTLPGGTASPYNLGHTATHEIGHYFGLLHTFENACRYPGDYCTDTPDEATPAFGCPKTRNSCPSAGLDPVTNYMDYSDDACMNNFTPGQHARMRWALSSYRRSLPLPMLSDPGSRLQSPVVRFLDTSPNPFNPTARVSFQLEREAQVSLNVYDVSGRQMARLIEGTLPAGKHESIFEGRQLASGVYMVVLTAGDTRLSQRMVLLK